MALTLGLKQLTLMMEHGLLLTPEELIIPTNPFAENEEPPQTSFTQVRACFTLARREELWSLSRRDKRGIEQSHSELFGEFSIGIDPVRARLLGAVPAIYFYDDASDSNLTHEILFHLRELRSVAIALARLEAKANLPWQDTHSLDLLNRLGFVLSGDPKTRDKIEDINPAQARAVLDYFDTDRPPAWNLVDWIDATLDFFQTADSKTSIGSLAYYQQREWRIVRLFGSHVNCYRLGPDRELDGEARIPSNKLAEVRARLYEMNPRFFNEDRLNEAALLSGTCHEPFFDFVDEIVCPASAERQLADLLDWTGLASRYHRKRDRKSKMTVFEKVQENG